MRLLPPDPFSVCPLPSTEFVELPPSKKNSGVNLPEKNPGYTTVKNMKVGF
jgi:hypothetical protein